MNQIPAELPDAKGNERLKAIYARIVEKMKEVVREFEITQDELHVAGDYLNRLGQSGFCRSLVDVSLAMTSVDVTARTEGGTRPNLEGPFHAASAPAARRRRPVRDGAAARLARASSSPARSPTPRPAAPISGRRSSTSGRPTMTAITTASGHHLSGRVRTDADGRYRIRTAVPRDYSDHDHDPIGELFRAMGRHNRRAAHIHAEDLGRRPRALLTTQLFIPGNPYLDSDYVEGAVSDDLMLDMKPVAGEPDTSTRRGSTSRSPRPGDERAVARCSARRRHRRPRASHDRAHRRGSSSAPDIAPLYLGGNAMALGLGKGQPFITLTETVEIVDAGRPRRRPAAARRCRRRLRRAGAPPPRRARARGRRRGGLHIDDQPYPKRASYHRGQGALVDGVADGGAAAHRGRGAARARTSSIVARTDALRVTGSVDETIERCRTYVEAGADALDGARSRSRSGRAVSRRFSRSTPLIWIGGVAPPIPARRNRSRSGLRLALLSVQRRGRDRTSALADLWDGLARTGAIDQSAETLARARKETLDLVDMQTAWDIEDAGGPDAAS